MKSQGSCGSCTAFAAATCFESREINQGTQNISFDASEQYLLECAPNLACSTGGYMNQVLRKTTGGPQKNLHILIHLIPRIMEFVVKVI